MIDWSKPIEDEEIDWSAPIDEKLSGKKRNPFPGEGLALGLGQWAADTLQGMASHGAEPEADIPGFLKPEKVRSKPETNRESLIDLEKHVDPSQNVQFNVGKYGPDVLGVGIPSARGATKFFKKHTNKAIGEKIVNTANTLQKKFGKEYESILGPAKTLQEGLFKSLEKEAKEAGMSSKQYFKVLMDASNKAVKKGDFKAFKQIAPKELTLSVKDFKKNPNIENAHDALVSAKSFVREMEGEKLVPSQRKAVNAAHEMVKGLDNYMNDTFKEIGKPELAEKFADLNKRYAKEMAPYLETKAIRQARLEPWKKEYLEPQDLPHELGLKQGRYFRRTKGKEFPELARNRFIADPYKMAALGATSYGSKELIKALLGEKK